MAEDRSIHLAIGDPARRDHEVAVVLDGITDAAWGDTLTPTELAARLDGVQMVFVGENHTDMEFHRVQLKLIQELHRHGRQVLVGLEMYPVPEQQWLDRPWQKVRDSVDVKLFDHAGELYVLARSTGRQGKETAMRRKRLVRLLRTLRAMRHSLPTRDQLLMRLGAAKTDAGRAFGFVYIDVPGPQQPVTRESFRFRDDTAKLNAAELRDGHSLLRSNLTAEDHAVLWTRYVQLTQIEAVFRSLKSELRVRPIHHQLEHRADAHILIAFLAYCLQVTLKHHVLAHAPGLTPASVLEKLATIQMIDVCIPTLDGRWLILPRYTQPDTDTKMLLHQLHIDLPAQPPPRITSPRSAAAPVLASAR
jgi:hypothetical protein